MTEGSLGVRSSSRIKMINGPFGDIRKYPRKDKLERDILNFSSNFFSNDVLVEDSPIYDIQKILVIGSWGRGNARPFVSDLDIVPLGYTTEDFGYLIESDSNYPIFSSIELHLWIPPNAENMLMEGISGEEGHGFIFSEEPYRAYNLTDRKTIKVVDGELKGLNLEDDKQ